MADLVGRPDEGELLDQRRRHGAGGLVLLAAQVEVGDLVDLVVVAHPARDVGVEVAVARTHPAEVQGVHRAQHVGRALDVVVDDDRDGGGDLEVVERAPRAVAGEALGQRVAVEVLVVR